MAKRKKRAADRKKLLSVFLTLLLLLAAFLTQRLGLWDTLFGPIQQPQATPADSFSDGTSVLLTAHFLDVGQGDSALFLSDGYTMLIDSGEAHYSDVVLDALSSYGVTKLDYLVATHAHSDHMGGMAAILSEIPTDNVLISEPSQDSALTAVYEKFMDAVEDSGASVTIAESGDTFSFGSASCTILAPFSVSQKNENNNSIVMQIVAGTTSFVMTGDAEAEIERQMIGAYPHLHADILKVGHHGSKTSTEGDFLDLLDPQYAVLSLGANNSYGHPHEDTLTKLKERGIEYYRTDENGVISVLCSADAFTIVTER